MMMMMMSRMVVLSLPAVAYPGIFFFLGGGVSTNSVQDRENRDLGVVVP